MDAVTGTIIGASVAGGSAVLAQIVAAIATSKRESRKLALDEKRFEADLRQLEEKRRREDGERFAEFKRQAYAELIVALDKFPSVFMALSSDREFPAYPEEMRENHRQLGRSFEEYMSSTQSLKEEIKLVSVPVGQQVEKFDNSLFAWLRTADDMAIEAPDWPDRATILRDFLEEFHEQRDRLQEAMRKSLGWA